MGKKNLMPIIAFSTICLVTSFFGCKSANESRARAKDVEVVGKKPTPFGAGLDRARFGSPFLKYLKDQGVKSFDETQFVELNAITEIFSKEAQEAGFNLEVTVRGTKKLTKLYGEAEFKDGKQLNFILHSPTNTPGEWKKIGVLTLILKDSTQRIEAGGVMALCSTLNRPGDSEEFHFTGNECGLQLDAAGKIVDVVIPTTTSAPSPADPRPDMSGDMIPQEVCGTSFRDLTGDSIDLLGVSRPATPTVFIKFKDLGAKVRWLDGAEPILRSGQLIDYCFSGGTYSSGGLISTDASFTNPTSFRYPPRSLGGTSGPGCPSTVDYCRQACAGAAPALVPGCAAPVCSCN